MKEVYSQSLSHTIEYSQSLELENWKQIWTMKQLIIRQIKSHCCVYINLLLYSSEAHQQQQQQQACWR